MYWLQQPNHHNRLGSRCVRAFRKEDFPMSLPYSRGRTNSFSSLRVQSFLLFPSPSSGVIGSLHFPQWFELPLPPLEIEGVQAGLHAFLSVAALLLSKACTVSDTEAPQCAPSLCACAPCHFLCAPDEVCEEEPVNGCAFPLCLWPPWVVCFLASTHSAFSDSLTV